MNQSLQLYMASPLKKSLTTPSAYPSPADLHVSVFKMSAPIISKDGLLIVQHHQPLSCPIELIVVPRSVLDGLLTAIHIKLYHPSKHQLQMVIQHHFFALDMGAAIA